jgi:hypothetical protein
LPKCCACDQAKYLLTFKGAWTKQRHPKDWPKNGEQNKNFILKTAKNILIIELKLTEALTHWSNIIGASHSPNCSMWRYGDYASDGLRELAKYGIVTKLEQEFKNHVKIRQALLKKWNLFIFIFEKFKSNYGLIRNIFTAKGLWFPRADGETSAQFTVSSDHNLLSFATMLGPSPDWLTGVSNVDLCLSNCTWMDSFMTDLYPFDAGTDSGVSYNVSFILFTKNNIEILSIYANSQVAKQANDPRSEDSKDHQFISE